ncbi:S41 family peptidase [Rhizobium lentis]|uniref:S41 family peptidase n=1 Tax=Rhizobium lentis TaxID=1138194 RepID=A0A9Q3M810_9HYPH|nr:S41 family peptidase [Rhizobium lentis]MBX4973136.1 S41 family peptidase [Rhizobium lentis]MBX5023558.1 S41 family peptidase [Rhizobium lentis]MBX5084334.1 S41 family peptidase [Rhizobium lentis]MBX5097609.1 S41 family peptidase [Rhizobium lentis]MBX5121672.1 S41 family peptidase [Rhizobium lentis]
MSIVTSSAVAALAFLPVKSDAPDERHGTGSAEGGAAYRELALFGEVLEQVRNRHVDAPKDAQLIRAAIDGMFTTLDAHSSYLPPERFDEIRRQDAGSFDGLGIEATVEDGVVKVTALIEDSPAGRAGIRANDRIVEVDGKPISGQTLEQMPALFLGEVGSTAELAILREGVASPIKLKLRREIITLGIPRLTFEQAVPVIRLASFSEQTQEGMERVIRAAVDGAGRPPAGIILDLRNNGGGPLDQARRVADAFLARGAIFYSRGRDERMSRYAAHPDAVDALIAAVPVIVLVNGGTASAAEIVAGALQDRRRATLVGTRTFGKGVVQTVIALGEHAGMSLTTARVYTPSNRSIQALGIEPDIEVVQAVPEAYAGKATVAGEAGLARHLRGEQGEATFTSSIYVPAAHADDEQLQYAIKLILGQVHHAAYPADIENDQARPLQVQLR